MRPFTVFVDEMSDTRPPSYLIALIPSSRSAGAMATKRYFDRETLAHDLQARLSYTAEATERFFSSEDKHHTLLNHSLAEQDSHYLGWLPDFDRH
jgi:hypothetical protein